MIRAVTFACCATIFAFLLTQDASAARRGGIHAASMGGASVRGAYRGGLAVNGYRGYRGAAWAGRRYWSGDRRWYGYAGRRYWRYSAEPVALVGAYSYYYRDYSYRRPSVYGWSSASQVMQETYVKYNHAPGTCGTYYYWQDGRCLDARRN
jgi:hypothetical protein